MGVIGVSHGQFQLGNVGWPLWVPILVLAYWLLPFDATPDQTPFGYWDDIGIALVIGFYTMAPAAR